MHRNIKSCNAQKRYPIAEANFLRDLKTQKTIPKNHTNTFEASNEKKYYQENYFRANKWYTDEKKKYRTSDTKFEWKYEKHRKWKKTIIILITNFHYMDYRTINNP